jgi:16S rRNA processing protein RimM
MDWIYCGKVGRPFGVRGQVSIFWNDGDCPISIGEGEVYLKIEEDYQAYKILADRAKGERHIVTLAGIDDRDAAQKLTGIKIYLPENALRELAEGEYYHYQLIGLAVVLESGESIGELVNVMATGANDVYEVMPTAGKAGNEILIPAIKDVIVSIDLENKIMVIKKMPGLF